MQRPNRSILIIGVQPPPLGGVTIHVQRLLNRLRDTDIEGRFIKTHHLLKSSSIKAFFKHQNIHVHSSNPFIRLGLALLCFLFNKNSFLTYHGNVGRYTAIKNWIDSLAIRLYRWPIVINKVSFQKAIKLNKETLLCSAFIPPKTIEPLATPVQEKIELLKERVHTLYCTNASNADVYKDGRETYQLSDLVELFNRHSDWGLIISDPSGAYQKRWQETGIELNSNIIQISVIHDFTAVIQQADVMIRFTTTDGDALSVKEALSQGKPVIVTNVVDRPEEVYLVDDNIQSLEKLIQNTTSWNRPDFRENGFEQLLQIYKKHLM